MLLGFPEVGATGDEEADDLDTSKMIQDMNRKKKRSGGFQYMGLSDKVFNGITKKGYRVPTPIQRKTIPLILDKKDVVAMARTGSGKTACFLLPMFERLKVRSMKGARALVLSPTRELSLQTLKFAKELGKFTGLRYECILGGDSIEKQFAALHDNPDVIFATPGRFVHLCVEMSLKLTEVEYVVFDEADRLFEMGFGEQLREILGRLPESRQTVLFSATLPKMLVDFAKAGLSDPTLIRLNVESKVPETLKMAFFYTRGDMKDACLLHLLKEKIGLDQQTVIFTATRHHVEYLQTLLELANITATYIYSNLDPSARKINVAKFTKKLTNVMVVTDVAARGIDIPLLDNVINYHFPAKSKLFVHRVGRVARAGREGTAYTFVGLDEIPYFIDLQLFLGGSTDPIPLNPDNDIDWHKRLGKIPNSVSENYSDQLSEWFLKNADLQRVKHISQNGYKQYLKSRPGASIESLKRSKLLKEAQIGIHPLLGNAKTDQEKEQVNILEQIKGFRPKTMIFEVGNTAKNKKVTDIINVKRKKHEVVIETAAKKRKLDEKVLVDTPSPSVTLAKSTDDDIKETFGRVVSGSKMKSLDKIKKTKLKKPKVKKEWKKDENYIAYEPEDKHTEAGYELDKGFHAQATNATLDLNTDVDEEKRKRKGLIKWDVKKKNYVKVQDDQKRIKTESGVYISASYKTNRYQRWKDKSKIDMKDEQEDGDERSGNADYRRQRPLPSNHPAMIKSRNAVPNKQKGGKRNGELMRPEQILKKRGEEEKKLERERNKIKKKKRK